MSVLNWRVGDMISDVEEDKLELRPFFQRRLVWTNTDKELFIDTVLRNYPFPEVFVATGSMDTVSVKRKRWLVDGQQRISTLKDYVRGSPDLLYKRVRPYADLSSDEQARFLDYEVAVRDLGTLPKSEIREIFRRINSTDYTLVTMEVLNAMFSGAYKKYCETLSRQKFFATHKVFPPAAQKRMYDITFCVILVTTILSGYYRRDERNEEFLERYNDDFPQQDEIQVGLDHVFDFVERCGFDERSRAWKQTDLFTLLVELYSAIVTEKLPIKPEDTGRALIEFFTEVDEAYSGRRLGTDGDAGESHSARSPVFRYLVAATKATNDKYARVERAAIIAQIIRGGGPPRSGQKQQAPPTGVRPKSAATKKPKKTAKRR